MRDDPLFLEIWRKNVDGGSLLSIWFPT
ncbi:hypothetical protein TorRG33x02_106990 [Trema orientale]|uniref:Uncharacterized protein n=1 Tax=Trema orientale TaxID=63057 RepID=A0A2P5F6L1_TREOI|nr:hypothetical protein TorRG33x02_106990 [Trema orientale]